MISTEKKQPIIQHIMPPKSNFDMGEENPSNSSIDLHSFFKPSKQESEVPLGVDKMNQQINLKEYGSEDRTIANENAENTKFFSSPVGLIFKNKEGIHEEIKGEPNQHFVEDRLDMSSDDEEKESDELIKLVNVHKTYLMGLEGVQALRGINLNVK